MHSSLEPVADVDPRRADADTGQAVDAVGVAPIVVGHDQRVPVEEDALELRVRAGGGAEGLAQQGEVEEEDRRGDRPRPPRHRPERTSGEPREEVVRRDEVPDQVGARDRRDEGDDPDPGRAPPRPAATARIGLDEAREVTEERLRAAPAAPGAARDDRGQQEEGGEEEGRGQDDEGLVHREGGAERVELPCRDVEPERALAADADEREAEDEGRLRRQGEPAPGAEGDGRPSPARRAPRRPPVASAARRRHP